MKASDKIKMVLLEEENVRLKEIIKQLKGLVKFAEISAAARLMLVKEPTTKKKENKMIKLGQKAKDKITFFTGILTARHQYITGCDQYTLSPSGVDDTGNLKEAYSFDEGRIEIIGPGITEASVKSKNPGGPQLQSKRVK